ncbi:MAG: alpha/beta hydrolase [Phycisphaeraceae bacterium]
MMQTTKPAAFVMALIICTVARAADFSDIDKADRVIVLWPDLAPGETTKSPGEALPRRESENPRTTRIKDITQPMLEVYEPAADKKNGVAVVICPGGAYNYVVRDKEGVEPARWLNGLGITAFVLRYRTKDGKSNPHWLRPLQDAQRALSLVRAHAQEWKLDAKRIGILGFSAGGNLATYALTRDEERAYEAIDKIDETPCRADFGMLIYPWMIASAKGDALVDEVKVTPRTPPTFLVQSSDDSATALNSVLFYAELKRNKVPGELHVYLKGGHGYGMRPVKDTVIDTWPQRAADWLKVSGIGAPSR